MLVRIEIECNNASFEDDFEKQLKLIFNQCVEQLRTFTMIGVAGQKAKLHDWNGNTVGFVQVNTS